MSLRGAKRRSNLHLIQREIASLTLAMTLCLSCGSGQVVEQLGGGQDEAVSADLAPSEKVYVAAAFFTDPVGSIATVGLNDPFPVQQKMAVTDGSDVVIRSFDNKLFVINRGITSTIQVIDPDSFEILGNYSVEPESNPHDLVVANGKAFISRYDANLADDNKDDVWVVNPTTGSLITGINLKPYTTDDGERLARASLMTLVGDFLYILIQDLSGAYDADTNGKIAVIDTRTNTVTTSISLTGRNPTSLAYHEGLGEIFVTDTGVFDDNFSVDLDSPYGGIEVIDAGTNTTRGILMDDKDFDGYLFSIVFASNTLGVVTVRAETVATFDPQSRSVVQRALYTTSSGFMPEVMADTGGRIWIPERHPSNDGIVILNPETGEVLSGPLAVGALPASLTLIH